MPIHSPQFQVSHAQSPDDLRAAQKLRYAVFIRELGGAGDMVDHAAQLECDRFDDFADHLLLRDLARPADDQTVGVYRLLTQAQADQAGQFYCEDEFDLTVLRQSGKRLLELGRSCLHPDYRGGAAMMHLWGALADYVALAEIDVLFGAASFHGTDVDRLAAPLSLLYHRHLAPETLRVTAKGPSAADMNRLPPEQIDRVSAMRDTPALIKAYLRLGGTVGDGAFVDKLFNTTDICMVLAADAVSQLQRDIYVRGGQNV
ncbi:ornithine-acyl-ACP acyltransferase [Loktanella sp. D2R18]|uniref:GNAT family N-acetyltransferase n=1 Tax=Rhodobacterales TaxID=204455 RepID=UPI000DEB21D4|nr:MULTISPECIES: GNAT family N-acyltransferase [Rhodobacterales]MDO6591605.1 GNAT family N-acyltransferase [Yoonia sp. 1_MG-2023]RBW43720.1 ornithine-acyl-ACP acyltransferase [Loktanella sp. D2R18]